MGKGKGIENLQFLSNDNINQTLKGAWNAMVKEL